MDLCKCGKPAYFYGVCGSSNGWWDTIHTGVPLCADHIGVIDLGEIPDPREEQQ